MLTFAAHDMVFLMLYAHLLTCHYAWSVAVILLTHRQFPNRWTARIVMCAVKPYSTCVVPLILTFSWVWLCFKWCSPHARGFLPCGSLLWQAEVSCHTLYGAPSLYWFSAFVGAVMLCVCYWWPNSWMCMPQIAELSQASLQFQFCQFSVSFWLNSIQYQDRAVE